jgi:serine/threonine-protein kinase
MPELARNGEVAKAISVNDWHFIAWTMIIFVYGVFMPNTWQRAASVLVPVALIPALVTLVLDRLYPSVAALLDQNQFGPPVLTPVAAAGIAIFAAHTIHGANLVASKARRLAQYQLIRLIGEGGMGQVYEAEHLLLKRACAVKRIQPNRSSDDRLLRRFQREVRATARLTHPHTIEVYDYGETKDGVFFFAMELLPGMNLRELVKVNGPLPPARAVHFLIEVCEALIEAHEAGMIHRDVKPANIFASQRGGIHDFTKLLDFGVVREIKVDPNLTMTSKMVAGTPSYMSPEQATTPLSIDARSDLYSVAAVGYFLLSGRPPFVGPSAMRVMLDTVNTPCDPLSMHRADVPLDVERVLMRCLEKEPAFRFQSARELRDELARCECAGGWSRQDALEWWNGHRAAVAAMGVSAPEGDTVIAGETEV